MPFLPPNQQRQSTEGNNNNNNNVCKEIMMDHALRTISYIADIGDLLVVMARRGPVATSPSNAPSTASAAISQTKICCHIFESDEVSCNFSHFILLHFCRCFNF